MAIRPRGDDHAIIGFVGLRSITAETINCAVTRSYASSASAVMRQHLQTFLNLEKTHKNPLAPSATFAAPRRIITVENCAGFTF